MKVQTMPIVLRVLVVLATLQSATATINSTFVIGIIGRLYDAYPLQTLPIFWSRYIEPTDSLFMNISQQLFHKYPIPQMHFTESSNEELRNILDANTTLSIVLTDHMSVEILKIVAARLRGMHLAKLLLVLREPVFLDQLRFFLNWLWEKQFINALVLFQDKATNANQIFTINAYPDLRWVNRTDVSDASKLLMKPTKDMNQYRIEILYMEDVPRVFLLEQHGEKKIVGRHANLMKLFAKHMNIKLVYNFQPDLDLEKILREFHNHNMELSVHSYSMFDLEEIGSSYPLETVRWCIMVPLRSEVPKSDYPIISFDTGTWIATGLSVIYIGILLRFIDPTPSWQITQKYFFLRSLAILMYSPNMAERMTMPTLRQFIFFAQVFVLGFILSCFYSTYLTSFCTYMVFQPPIDSVEDLVKENLRVMVIDYELEAIRTRAIYGETFLKLLYPVSYLEVNTRRANFDERYAYSIRQDRWNFLNKQQRGLEKVFFRLSKICFGRHFTMFPLQFDSHLRTHLDMFILIVMQAGLDLFWDEEAFRMAVSMKLSKVLVEKTVVVQPLRLDYFQHVYAGYWSLIGISCLIFVIEVLYDKFFVIRKALKRAQALEEYAQRNDEENSIKHL